MIIRWLIRLAFPALGVLLLLMIFGVNTPENSAEPPPEKPQAKIPAFEGLVPPPVPTEGPDIVFKWQDNRGHWHYADQPPSNGPWNALAIERAGEQASPASADPEPDWEAPYKAPFSLDQDASNGS